MQPKTEKMLMWAGIGVAAFVVVAMVLTGPLMIKGFQQKSAVDRFFSEYSAALVNKDHPRATIYAVLSSGPQHPMRNSWEIKDYWNRSTVL